MASLTPAVLSTARQGHQSAGRDWGEGMHDCWGVYGCCGCPQASSTCAGGTSMDRGKAKWQAVVPSACSVCLCSINVALAHVLILVLGTVDGHSATP